MEWWRWWWGGNKKPIQDRRITLCHYYHLFVCLSEGLAFVAQAGLKLTFFSVS
jgi:hypothetical protein